MTVLDHLGAAELRAAVCGYRDALRAHQDRLNRLNVYPVPDGDTGTNMALTLESVVTEMGAGGEMAAVCKAISHGSLMGARGNSGVILSQVLRGLTDGLRDRETVDAAALADALAQASTAAYGAVMRPVEGTILTVAREAAEAAQVEAKDGSATLVSVLEAAATAGAASLDRTPTLLPVLAEAGVVDAGGAGYLLLIDALLQVVDGRALPAAPAAAAAGPVAAHAMTTGDGHGSVGDLRYEVMFLLAADDGAVEGFKAAWMDVGDSIAIVGGDGLWNCHIHTDDIGAAIEAGVEAGRPTRIRVTDLAEQVAHEQCEREAEEATATGTAAGPATAGPATAPAAAAAPAPAPAPAEPVTTAVVAVASGEGATGILASLGARSVVAGGQSMNPSTAELLAAIEASNAEGVVLLPNNKNIVPVAHKAAEAASRPVQVVPTTSIAEGFAAMMGFDPEADAEVNAEAMAAAADDVAWGEVTWAVRDATTPAGPVHEGDHLAFLGHDVVAVAPGLAECACALLEQLVGDDHELVTIVEGAAATDDATGAVKAWLAQHRPGVEAEVLRGDQPLAAYLFSAE
ncbi:MAG: DAK2 domain-containing protein [Actinomycetota bacterium]